MKNKLAIALFVLPLLSSCCLQKELTVNYIKDGNILQEKIPTGQYIVNDSSIRTPYTASFLFYKQDSISFENGNSDRLIIHKTPIKLDFSKRIKRNSAEYYTIATAYYTDKVLSYYSDLFKGKLTFNEAEYSNIDVVFGDMGLLSTPKRYVFEKGQPLSPSIFYHEVGHRAFWMIEDSLRIKFKGLSYIHVGLMEYFTVSLHNSPLIGEGVLLGKLMRNASLAYSYPHHDSLCIGNSVLLLKETYSKQLQDSTLSITKYYKLLEKEITGDIGKIVDNHKGSMLITSMLWRIRQQIGQANADKLVVASTLALNDAIRQRNVFYKAAPNETMKDRVQWYDLLWSLLQKDKELYGGANQQLIVNEFKQTSYPVEKVAIP